MRLRSHFAVAVARPVTTAPIRPLAWEIPYVTGAALEKAKQTNKQKRNERGLSHHIPKDSLILN